MGALDAVRGRDEDGRLAQTIVAFEDIHSDEGAHATGTVDDAKKIHGSDAHENKHAQVATSLAADGGNPLPTDSTKQDNGSETSFGVNGLDDDSKEFERNPDHVTMEASLGQQKAEAAALVWNRPTVILIYIW